MRPNQISLILLLVAAGGCSGDLSSPETRAPRPPSLTVGPTTRVDVSCPANLVDGQSGQCTALGYDANNQFTSSSASWSTSTPSLVSVNSSGNVTAQHLASGTAQVTATIEGVPGSANISVSQSDLAVSISQPSSIRPNAQCYWFATVSGGNGPYTYSWSRSGGTSTSTTNEFSTQSSSSFTIFLTVTDALGTWRSVSKSITVTSSAFICPT